MFAIPSPHELAYSLIDQLPCCDKVPTLVLKISYSTTHFQNCVEETVRHIELQKIRIGPSSESNHPRDSWLNWRLAHCITFHKALNHQAIPQLRRAASFLRSDAFVEVWQ